jgi:predicted lipoprotein with Yx(FWY)xxD motif
MIRPLLTTAAALTAALSLVACGGSSSSSSSPAASSSSSAGQTVAVKTIAGLGDVLVDSSGMPLYTSNLDAGGTPACNGACADIWKPLTVASGAPSAASAVGTVATVTRPDGTKQVAVGGKPLYTFVQDAPGKPTGNGVTDSFAGHTFTWNAVLAGGTTASGSGSQSGSTGGAYRSSGY